MTNAQVKQTSPEDGSTPRAGYKDMGQGVFATAEIPKDTQVGVYWGNLMPMQHPFLHGKDCMQLEHPALQGTTHTKYQS